MDIGRAWIEFGITVPDAPRIVLGYELQFRDGTKSMLEWGPVVQNGFVRSIYPASKNISERTHIVKLDVSYQPRRMAPGRQRAHRVFSDRTGDRQITAFTTGPNPDAFIRTHQDFNHVQGANVLVRNDHGSLVRLRRLPLFAARGGFVLESKHGGRREHSPYSAVYGATRSRSSAKRTRSASPAWFGRSMP